MMTRVDPPTGGIIMAVAVVVVKKEKSLMTYIDIVMKGVNAVAERNPAPAETAGHGNNILDDSKVNIDSSFIYLNCVMLPTASLSS